MGRSTQAVNLHSHTIAGAESSADATVRLIRLNAKFHLATAMYNGAGAREDPEGGIRQMLGVVADPDLEEDALLDLRVYILIRLRPPIPHQLIWHICRFDYYAAGQSVYFGA